MPGRIAVQAAKEESDGLHKRSSSERVTATEWIDGVKHRIVLERDRETGKRALESIPRACVLLSVFCVRGVDESPHLGASLHNAFLSLSGGVPGDRSVLTKSSKNAG